MLEPRLRTRVSVRRSEERNPRCDVRKLGSGGLAGAEASIAGDDGRRRSGSESGTPGGTSSSVTGHGSLGASRLHGTVDDER